jgi:hypothetical protein
MSLTRRLGPDVPKGAYLMNFAVTSASALNLEKTEAETLRNAITTTSPRKRLGSTRLARLTSFTLKLCIKLERTKPSYTLRTFEPFTAVGINETNNPGKAIGKWNDLRPLSAGLHVTDVWVVPIWR